MTIPEVRKRDGLVQIMTIRENLTLSALPSFARGFHLSLRAKAAKAARGSAPVSSASCRMG